MNRKEHQVVISLFLAVSILFMFSVYMDTPSGNVVNSGDELELINCVIKDDFEVCDVQYTNGEIVEEGYRKRV